MNRFHRLAWALVLGAPLLSLTASDRIAEDGADVGWAGSWIFSKLRAPVTAPSQPGFLLQGTGERNNPLRRELAEPFRGNEIFVRFRLVYEPPDEASEFFVLWLDRLDGGDTAVHGDNIPNIGVHVAESGPLKGRTVFMVRKIGRAHV